MTIQPIPDYRCCTCTSCTHDRGKTPPAIKLPKLPMEVNNQDKFVRSDKSVPEKNDKNIKKRIGTMFSSGGGTN